MNMKALKALVATVALAIAATAVVAYATDGQPCQRQCQQGEVCKAMWPTDGLCLRDRMPCPGACKEKCGNGENCKAQSKQTDAKAAKAAKAVKEAKAPQVVKATK